jgi:hypothetical protein
MGNDCQSYGNYLTTSKLTATLEFKGVITKQLDFLIAQGLYFMFYYSNQFKLQKTLRSG